MACFSEERGSEHATEYISDWYAGIKTIGIRKVLQNFLGTFEGTFG